MFEQVYDALERIEADPYAPEIEGWLETVSNVFYDVALPDSPLALSPEEAVTFTTAAASDLKAVFADCQGVPDVEVNIPALAVDADPLWRELAAANWEFVSQLDAERVMLAATFVGGLLQQSAAQDEAEGIDSNMPAALERIISMADDPDSDFTRQSKAYLAGMSLGLHHLRKAALILLEEISGS
jgi:hypothetical protein